MFISLVINFRIIESYFNYYMIVICFLYEKFSSQGPPVLSGTIFTEIFILKITKINREVEMAALPHLDFAPLLADEPENEEFDVFAAGKLLLFTLKITHFNN